MFRLKRLPDTGTVANVEMAGIQNNYLTELIISQKGTRVKGFSDIILKMFTRVLS
jgi:hypothetical protein